MTVYMPPIEAYMALAEAMHYEDDTCNATYYIPFAECGTREWDIEQSVKVLGSLHRLGWIVTRDPAGTIPLSSSEAAGFGR